MAVVVFLRGVNVGGTRTFRPGVLAKDLAKFDVVNIGAAGTFVVRLWRRMGPRLIYPNEVVEKKFGVPATTRGWNTIEAICHVLGDG